MDARSSASLAPRTSDFPGIRSIKMRQPRDGETMVIRLVNIMRAFKPLCFELKSVGVNDEGERGMYLKPYFSSCSSC